MPEPFARLAALLGRRIIQGRIIQHGER